MSDQFGYLSQIGREKSNLIKGLQAVQTREGYVSNEAVQSVAAYFDIPVAEVEGVLTFYAQFRRNRPGRFKISVCDGTACHIKGSDSVHKWVSDLLKIGDGETDAEGRFSLQTVACLGCCSLAPVMSINGKVYGKLDRKAVARILKEYEKQ